MDTKLLDDILSCPSLPSLPAVAVRVLELTSDPDVELEALAKVITCDQGIASKILRTVNSSFFGLRRRCTSIDHALVMLGLGPVKSLVLGFSLFKTVSAEDGDPFDYEGYWKRSLTSAVAAKYTAGAVGNADIVDEVFLIGLFQDIGMIAMHRTLGERYLKVIEETEKDHTRLAKLELREFELQHSAIGAMICEKWGMPYEIIIPVRYHDRATACPQQFGQATRCVALGNMIHELLEADDPTDHLRQIYRRGMSWLGLSEQELDRIIRETGDSVKELASLFSVSVGSISSAEEVLANADRQLIEMARNQQVEDYPTKQFAELVQDEEGFDPLTGALGREGFAHAIRDAFPAAHSGQMTLGVVQVVINGYEDLSVKDQDEVVISTAVMLRKHFEHMGGLVCRLSDWVFSVVLPGTTRVDATHVAGRCCAEFDARLPSWLSETPEAENKVSLSVGVATLDDDTRAVFTNADRLVKGAQQAVMAARSSDGSATRAFVPRRSAA